MFVGASNVCKWVNTRKPGYCDKPCVGAYCAFHTHAIKNERPLAEACKNCKTNGTRSTTGLCQECGASNKKELIDLIETNNNAEISALNESFKTKFIAADDGLNTIPSFF